MLAASCSRPTARLIVGVKRAAVELAFTDDTIDEPRVERAVRSIAPGEVIYIVDEGGAIRSAPRPRPPSLEDRLCPAAPAGGRPSRVVTEVMAFPPKPGVYTYLADGRLRIETTILGVNVKFPDTITREVRNLVKDPPVTLMGVETGRARWQYEVVDRFGTAEMVRTYHITPSALRLVKYERKVANSNVAFVPHEGVIQYNFGSQGTSWGRGRTADERGVDLLSRTVMTSNGVIEKREALDHCGDWTDTFVARSFDEIITLDASYSMATHETDGWQSAYATHITSLPVAETIRYTEQTTSGDPPLPISLEWRYSLKLVSFEPQT